MASAYSPAPITSVAFMCEKCHFGMFVGKSHWCWARKAKWAMRELRHTIALGVYKFGSLIDGPHF